ncbi:PnuC-like nicotinamide riboside transporter [Arthrobacter phage Argan]|nr:PnuC-like Nicotinamide riboside transporter [Arthrobacter phage Zeina]WNT45453.1 PnuC-like nicotinamide riboside transporter [Arthrobacter phage Argan]
MEQILSWVVGIIGITGFFLAGKRVWWCWYLNIFCQIMWVWYAFVSNTPAFFVTAGFYTVVFSINAWKWTKEHLTVKRMLEEEAERTNRIELPKYY